MCSIWRSTGPPFQRPFGRPWPVPNDPRISAGIYRVFSSRCKTMGRPGCAALERSGNPPRHPVEAQLPVLETALGTLFSPTIEPESRPWENRGIRPVGETFMAREIQSQSNRAQGGGRAVVAQLGNAVFW